MKERWCLLLLLILGCTGRHNEPLVIAPAHIPFYDLTGTICGQLSAGIKRLEVTSDGSFLLHDGFNLKLGKFERPGFLTGLTCVSTFQATGDSAFLSIAQRTAAQLDEVFPSSGIIPFLELSQGRLSLVHGEVSVSTQANVLSLVCALSNYDPSVLPLTRRLADGILVHCIDPRTGLAFQEVESPDGSPHVSPTTGLEAQFGASSCFAAEALMLASEATGDARYAATAKHLLMSIWDRRVKRTDLISEVWDLAKDSAGTRLYPGRMFRYDDMGGAYLRALMCVDDHGQDTVIRNIIERYTRALIRGIWDARIGGGGFRYLNNVEGTEEDAQVETMYGLFIGTLLRAMEHIDDPTLRALIIDRCRQHADHVLLTTYGVKHFMIPHNLNEGGGYTNHTNDSELAYAALQFPYGLSSLSQVTSDQRYWRIGRQLYDTLIERHEIRDTTHAPPGFIDMIETTPPFGPEQDYYSWEWCREMLYAPSYILFASVQPGPGVSVDWYHGGTPIVLGLVNGMMYWDPRNVWIDKAHKRFHFIATSTQANGSVGLNELGFVGIKNVRCDEGPSTAFSGNNVILQPGKHAYTVTF